METNRIHNDYSYGATPKLEFFADRAEVTSMGGLPYGVTEQDFFGGCSVPRNKEIMRVFRDLEIVEHLGSGVPRILKACGKEAFEIRDSYVRIVFRYAKPISMADDASQKNVRLEPGSEQRLVGGLAERLVGGLVESQRRILDLISENPRIPKREMAARIGISTTAIDKNIAALKSKGYLLRFGSAKGGYWQVLEGGHE